MTSQVTDALTEQRRVLLTPHPLQRVGAFAMARLGRVSGVEDLIADLFDQVVGQMCADAENAALKASTKDTGAFWLKASGSFFPNSKMNHPSRSKKSRDQILDEVRAWRRMPEPGRWPAARCVLCGRQACGFYGKTDVMLAASVAYRNTTPRGHDGLALCFACLCCFYALPYGSVLTGGPSVAVHSWDDGFLARTTRQQTDATRQRLTVDDAAPLGPSGPELVALKALRKYERRLRAGVELLVFSNNNQDQMLDAHALDQPLAEWLRTTMTDQGVRAGFWALLRAHASRDRSGSRRLAWNAFHAPAAILSTAVGFLRDEARRRPPLSDAGAALVPLCFSYVSRVMGLNKNDVDQVRAVADRIAVIVSSSSEPGPLSTFRARHRKPADLRAWLKARSVEWTLGRYASDGETPAAQPLVTTAQWRLLFDPAEEEAWAYRELLLIAVLERLHERGWRPATSEAPDQDDGDDAQHDEVLAQEDGYDGNNGEEEQ